MISLIPVAPGCHLPSTYMGLFSSRASHDIKYMNSRSLLRLVSSPFSACVFFMAAFCIGTFAELAPHRWFGLWHSLIAMKPWVQLLGCKELHNACAIQCTSKTVFLGPQMTQETDTRKGLHLTKHPFKNVLILKNVPIHRRMVVFGDQIW